jgi:hypothetical protein
LVVALVAPAFILAIANFVGAGRSVHVAAAYVVAGLILLTLAGGIVGTHFLFYPTRIAFGFFLWALLMVGLPEMCTPPSRASRVGSSPVVALLLVCNLAGLTGLLVVGSTTNWAYAIPNKEIAAYIAREAARTEAEVLITPYSFAQIELELERHHPSVRFADRTAVYSMTASGPLVVLLETKSLALVEALNFPPDAPKQAFVRDPPEAVLLKKFLRGSAPPADKLVVVTGQQIPWPTFRRP